jgi:two-component system sensor histidine kinase/response regulator
MGDLKATILIVDDDPVVQSSVADILRIAGYGYLTAVNGIEALQLMEQQRPDLIVADIMMPEMDGYELYEAIRENPAWIPIPFVFLSAKGEQKDIRKGYGLGADHYLTKPFEPEDLLTIVQARLKRAAEIRSITQQELEQTKERLMTIIEHELTGPLSRVYGFVSMLEDGYHAMDDYVIQKLLRDTRQSTARLVRLVEDLMLLMNIDSGLMEIEIARYREPVAVEQIVGDVVGQLQPLAENRDVSIAVSCEANLVVSGMPHYIEDIVRRLLDNAIKFSKPEGHVWIEANAADDMGILSVRDDGIGIPPDGLSQLFQRFEQIAQDESEERGAGLGLAIAGQLVRLHGGDIRVESRLGEGSTFTVALPL